jgi:hypothetical protein
MNSNNRGGSWTPEVVLGFPESRFHARGLAVALGVTYVDVEIHVFPDGESRVRIADIDAIRSKRAALYRSLDTPNTKIIELILAASVLGAGAAPMLIAPYLPYMRQDKAFSAGLPAKTMPRSGVRWRWGSNDTNRPKCAASRTPITAWLTASPAENALSWRI